MTDALLPLEQMPDQALLWTLDEARKAWPPRVPPGKFGPAPLDGVVAVDVDELVRVIEGHSIVVTDDQGRRVHLRLATAVELMARTRLASADQVAQGNTEGSGMSRALARRMSRPMSE